MYYSVWCLQNKDYMHTGRNSTSLKQAICDIFEYLITDFDEEENDYKNFTLKDKKEYCEEFEFRFKKHTKKIPEN
ncbi:MAG: hypothetical protein PHY56_00125 [Candidatus Omnitrophica bacterium]|nr:hypothetical protein [Candidatus Omnitrophota bacterium]